jgi:glycogen debranching enzyme
MDKEQFAQLLMQQRELLSQQAVPDNTPMWAATAILLIIIAGQFAKFLNNQRKEARAEFEANEKRARGDWSETSNPNLTMVATMAKITEIQERIERSMYEHRVETTAEHKTLGNALERIESKIGRGGNG